MILLLLLELLLQVQILTIISKLYFPLGGTGNGFNILGGA